MIKIIFETHATTFDNEAGIASGWSDVQLSPLGIDQANELGQRYRGKKLDAIFVSDLIRSYHTAEIAFYGKHIPIIQDKRLRECDYGDFEGKSSQIVNKEKVNHIEKPFPNGESYEQTTERMKSFLDSLKEFYDGKTVMIIGHRATQYGLESIILNKPLEELVSEEFHWQPGWEYQY